MITVLVIVGIILFVCWNKQSIKRGRSGYPEDIRKHFDEKGLW